MIGVNMKNGGVPESWLCVDCGFDTAPRCPNRAELETALAAAGDEGVTVTLDSNSEVYCVRKAVWAQAGMPPMGGCLCIGCLEHRLGRELRPKDFLRDHPFNTAPGTPRLLQRRGQRELKQRIWADFLATQEQAQ